MKRKTVYYLGTLLLHVGFSVNPDHFQHSQEDFLKSHCLKEMEMNEYTYCRAEGTSKQFIDKNYSDQDLKGYDFSDSLLINVCFEGCDLTNIKFEGSFFINVNFKKASLSDDFKFIGIFKKDVIIEGIQVSNERFATLIKATRIMVKINKAVPLILVAGLSYSLGYNSYNIL